MDSLLDSFMDCPHPTRFTPWIANPISRPTLSDTVLRDEGLVCKPREEHSGDLWMLLCVDRERKADDAFGERGRERPRRKGELRASSEKHNKREEKGPRKP